MPNYITNGSDITLIADSLRSAKHLVSEQLIFPEAFASAVSLQDLNDEIIWTTTSQISMSYAYNKGTQGATGSLMSRSTYLYSFPCSDTTKVVYVAVASYDTNFSYAYCSKSGTAYIVYAGKFVDANASYYSSKYSITLEYGFYSKINPYQVKSGFPFARTIDNGIMISGSGSIGNGSTNLSFYDLSYAEGASTITNIGTNVFKSCKFQSVAFPGCVTIGSSAFQGCTQLSNVSFPNCTTIGQNAFKTCMSLKTVSFPKCTSLDASAFCQCNDLTSAYFSLCTFIPQSAFYSCRSLQTVDFPECLSTDSNAFTGCSSLLSVSFSKCTTLGSSTFYLCSRLTSVNLPECMTLSSGVFFNCYSLAEISIPKCVSVGSNAFAYCSSLQSIVMPSCTSIYEYAFRNCSSLSIASFNSCSQIAYGAFMYCSSLESISFPSCKVVGTTAFSNCYALSCASFPACISVSSSAFVNCRSLGTILFGSAMSSFSGYVFTACSVLSSIYCLASSIPYVFSYTFSNIPYSDYVIYVKSSLYESYLTATNWTYVSSHIASLTDEQIAAL